MTYIGSRLKYLRKLDKITQQQLADAIGVVRSTICMYENGQREPDFETLEALADYFNVDMRTFFPGDALPSSMLPSAEPSIDPAIRDILDILSDFTPEERALAKSRLLKIRESR